MYIEHREFEFHLSPGLFKESLDVWLGDIQQFVSHTLLYETISMLAVVRNFKATFYHSVYNVTINAYNVIVTSSHYNK